ncbi:MAG TPA: T9SS type A sorting domain-containing protein [Dysgonomonas sp.]|uniref:T9SS type A sorting domain-containing protein n=2 Tax=unclassified Dysgonomonas TaxID=2630389 RepID=UPI002CBFEC77|nr:T9SS type A sorting domain-containing protein [Dysgonomonas sp.]HML66118.1 T9SS type A sorting domain-containing protein [Dysgonomonas sp.]
MVLHCKYIRFQIFSVLFICYSFCAPVLKAQFTITENFKKSSVGSNIVLGGNPKAYLTSGNPDPVNEGWLRLTKDDNSQRGYAYIDTPFPSTLGVYIDFEYKTWRSKSSSADGICLFLFDADTPTFRIGAFGGSLGYAPSNRADGGPGLAGAYLGVGLDEYGNFASNQEGKDGPSSDLSPNSITLRGPETPKNSANPAYRFLKSKKVGGSFGNIAYGPQTSTRPTDSQFYRRVRIYIEPDNGKYKIKVQWATTPNGAFEDLIDYETEDIPPAKLKLGFSASTGGFVNYHEIRNILITTPGDVLVQKNVDKENSPQDGILTYTVNVINNSTSILPGLVLKDVIKDGNGNDIVYGSTFSINTVTFKDNGNTGNTAVGFTSGTDVPWDKNSLTATITLAPHSTSTFIIKGKLNGIPSGGKIINNVDIVPPEIPNLNDDKTNNHSTVSTTVYNPNLDLSLEKDVDNHGVAQAAGNIFTITVTNLSGIDKVAGNAVTVTDVIPEGLTVTDYTGRSGGLTANGWTPSVSGNIYTFKRTDALNALLSYPPIIIKVTPDSPTTQINSWTNTARVQYNGDINPDNDSDNAILKWYNYWYGTTDTDWAKQENWTANFVPAEGDNIEFATETNNGISGAGNGKGTAIKDLYLDKDRIIGDLINDSNVDLVVTTENQLIINGVVRDNNPNKGTIVVKTSPDKPTGTLLFTNPDDNQNVNATVEFYNKAYECATCGFYRKQWQYFGIPVQSSGFPYLNPQVETVNQWVEPFNGNKWQPAPYTPDTDLKAFKGYEMTSSSNVLPTHIYSFIGSLNVGDANVSLTRSVNVNYPGMNLIGNSFTAAIPITSSAINLGGVTLNDNTAYLFNTGTRDQWRKLDGGAVMGVAAGQYQAVPFNLSGQAGIPDRILSMHTFMLNVTTPGNIILKYDELTKNELNSSTITPWKSAELRSSTTTELPHIVMDVIAEGSADRVWLFEQADATTGFDNGWDGYKIKEGEIIQTYVSGSDQSDYQIATVSEIEGTTIAVKSALSESYTINFSVTPDVEHRKLYLKNLVTGRYYPIVNNEKYTIARSASSGIDRFLVTASSSTITDDALASLLTIYVLNNIITVNNQTEEDCIATVYDMMGRTVANKQVHKNEITEFTELSYGRTGIYIVKVEGKSKSVNKTDRVLLK